MSDKIFGLVEQVLDSRGHLLTALGYGLWPSMVLISEIVQTFILADFCYYYVKRSGNSTWGVFFFFYKCDSTIH